MSNETFPSSSSKKKKIASSLLAGSFDGGAMAKPLSQDFLKEHALENLVNQQSNKTEDSIKEVNPSEIVKREKDVSTNNSTNGLYIHPLDQRNAATQNSEYVITPPDSYSRLFVVCNLPLAWRITFGVAEDCWNCGDNYPFTFVESQESQLQKTNWSDRALKIFRDINFFKSGPQHMGIGEMDGEALLVLIEEDFDWEKTDTTKPRDPKKKIIDTLTVPMYYVYKGAVALSEWNNDGTPMFWYIYFGSVDEHSRRPTARQMKFHSSRIIHYCPQPVDVSTRGLCTLDRCWQALLIGFNIDLGIGEAFFRWGIGHPVFETEFDDIKQLKKFMDELGSPNRRTWHALLKGMSLKFVGAEGQALDFAHGKETAVYDEVSIGTRIPRPVLKGEVAGVQTGSEVNERQYWSLLQQKQTGYNEVVWKLLAVCKESGQIPNVPIQINPEFNTLDTPENIIIRWSVHYVQTEEQRVSILLKKLEAINPLKDILKINELRKFVEELLNVPKGTYPPLEPYIGEQLLSIFESGRYNVNEFVENEPGEIEKENQTIESKVQGKAQAQAPQVQNLAGKSTIFSNNPAKNLTNTIPKVPSNESAPKANKRILDENDPDRSDVIGCPDHSRYRKNCPVCMRIVKHKETLAYDLLGMGYSVNQVQDFTRLNRNRVQELRKEFEEKMKGEKNAQQQ